jgi:lysophospholipase L1-like esterase
MHDVRSKEPSFEARCVPNVPGGRVDARMLPEMSPIPSEHPRGESADMARKVVRLARTLWGPALVALASALACSVGRAGPQAAAGLAPLAEAAEPSAEFGANAEPSRSGAGAEGVALGSSVRTLLDADVDPHQPVLSDELQELRRLAQERVLGGSCPPGSAALAYASDADRVADPVGVDSSGDEMRGDEATRTDAPGVVPEAPRPGCEPSPALGRFLPVENEASLEHFHRALARLDRGGSEKVRVLAYGASHTQGDFYTGYLRAYLQSRFGEGGQGFVFLGQVNRWYRTLDTEAQHRGLAIRRFGLSSTAEGEPLGLFGAALVGQRSHAYGEITTSSHSRDSLYEVQYYRDPKGGTFTLEVDGEAVHRVSTRGDAPGLGHFAFETTPGQHVIRAALVGDGPVRLFGIVGETPDPGVVVDTLGIGGARLTVNLHWDEATWAESLRHRRPDLVTFAYGTNEGTDKRAIDRYEDEVREVLGRLGRAAPGVSCVLIAPFDVPRDKAPRLLDVIDVQRRLAREYGCAFWDGHGFMGGPGSIVRWAKATPPLASADHIHLTRRGYVYAGVALGDALMRAYDAEVMYGSGAPAGRSDSSARLP